MALAPWQRRRLIQKNADKARLKKPDNFRPKLNTTDAQYQVSLENDCSRLRAITSHTKRDELKAEELLPRYREYLKGVMEAEQGGQNDVLVQNIIWSLDAGPDQFGWAYELADYAIEHNMATPDNFQRDVLNVLMGQIADWCIQKLKLNQSPEPHATTAYEYASGQDVVDQIQAQLLRCQAEKYKTTDIEKALEQAEAAYKYDEKVGVMPLIKQLQKQQTEAETPQEKQPSTV